MSVTANDLVLAGGYFGFHSGRNPVKKGARLPDPVEVNARRPLEGHWRELVCCAGVQSIEDARTLTSLRAWR
jgi:hypothetical protein